MILVRRLIGALALCLATAACGAAPALPDAPGSTPAARPTAPPAVAPTPNGTDVAWLQLLIAMNERLVPVLALAPERAQDPALARRADVARASRTAELSALRRLATRVTLPAENPHAGHDMPGMTTVAQRTALAAASGAEFDRLFTGALQAHLDQAARLCAGEQKSGADPAFRALAASIGRTVATEGARSG
jgi:uncharacterized protein (DUF305 family)